MDLAAARPSVSRPIRPGGGARPTTGFARIGILGVVVTLSGAAPARGGWRSVAYWVVWALLFVGVCALHSVADHDAVGLRHASVVTPVSAEHFEVSSPVISALPTGRDAATVPADHDGVHEACILFLAGGAWVLMLLMERIVKRRHGSLPAGILHPWQRLRADVRPPGLSAPLRFVELRL